MPAQVAIVLGAAFGLVLQHATSSTFWRFETEAFYYILLPPIIFEAGYSLKRRLFFQNIAPILTFAVVGTLISTLALTGILYAGSALGWTHRDTLGMRTGDGIKEALLFSTMISATDPVATLAILASPEVGADAVLQAVLFGESVLNDAVTIVLYRALTIAGAPRLPEFAHAQVCPSLRWRLRSQVRRRRSWPRSSWWAPSSRSPRCRR